ncbi:MAG TPA: DUF3618 domain-containing protein [Allosphingosinicella sp.]
MNAETIEAAKRDAEAARRRLDSTLVALQQRLHPKTLANEAWDGVKEKSNDLAEGAMDAVKQRPGAVSLAVGAAFLFLARKPLGRAVGKVFSHGDEDDGRIVTTVETDNENYNAAAPVITAPLGKGVN